MTVARNGRQGRDADRDDMRTPRRHRITRRQSEQVLDGRGGPEDLARLLDAARRPPAPGELGGEADALLAFRECAVADPAPETRSLPVRTLMLSRTLVAKVLATTTAVVAIGGVAVAATGHLPAPHLPARATSAHPAVTPTAKPTDRDGDHDRTGPVRTGDPSHDPRHRDDVLPAVGLCRAWSDVSRNAPDTLRKSKAFQELAKKAGGPDKVAAYCASLVDQWCSAHRWPTRVSVGVAGKPYLFRCERPLPTAKPTAIPTPGYRMPGTPTGSPRTGPPVTVMPTGAPVHS